MEDFKYDIAFSFLSEDETTISQLNDLLKDRLKTFFFPERLRDVVGTDGEKTFSKVFQSDTRMAVIIYRDKWGSTDWTRIEQTAIRNRGFDETYEFALLIPMERPVSPPIWFPKQQIWFDLERLGITGAAAVIEQRVRGLGGIPKPETIENAAEQVKREIKFRLERETYLRSGKALADAVAEVRGMFTFTKDLANKLKDPASNLVFEITENNYVLEVLSWGFIFRISWYNKASNMLYDFRLVLSILKLNYDRIERVPSTSLEEKIFDFDINQLEEPGWIERSSPDRFFISKHLVETTFKRFLDHIRINAASIGK